MRSGAAAPARCRPRPRTAYLDDALPTDQRPRLERHLAGCRTAPSTSPRSAPPSTSLAGLARRSGLDEPTRPPEALPQNHPLSQRRHPPDDLTGVSGACHRHAESAPEVDALASRRPDALTTRQAP
ncbi:zf-HC2 domain-containing protein [Jatrophihabitans lederbergiae]|uniref:zf-HC2 domain-containing protein n=1 Tax=Jatrophihabitans lederbergiae TaxID=3075547 RepID=UPI0037C1A534